MPGVTYMQRKLLDVKPSEYQKATQQNLQPSPHSL